MNAKCNLAFPFETPPDRGKTIEVVPGVHWIRMPLPLAPRHVNVWALDDGDGWILVDTGRHTTESVAAWQVVLSSGLGGRPVNAVLCTHMHSDHAGMAGWLTRRCDCELWMTRAEYLSCRIMTSADAREADRSGIRFYRATGSAADPATMYRRRFEIYSGGFSPLPASYRRLRHGQIMRIGDISWEVLVSSGHSPEHACLYCRERKVFIAGDQVLPGISSNISVSPTEPEADPLADWIESLNSIRQAVSADVLVLPSHGLPFQGLHCRVEALIGQHQQDLMKLVQALVDPKRAIDVFEVLFARPVEGDLLTEIAIGESLAHLSWLACRGMISKHYDRDGVCWFKAQPFQ